MHTTYLALEVATYGSVMSLAIALVLSVSYRRGRRGDGVRFRILAWFCMSFWCFALAISAGPDPMFQRVELAFVIRALMAITFSAFGASYIVFILSTLRASKQAEEFPPHAETPSE